MKLFTLIEHWLDNYPVAKQAKLLGLRYAGYGRWKDDTGKIIAKTIDGKLKSIKGLGDETVQSPADFPNNATAQPIAGDSADGRVGIKPKHDAYMGTRLPVSNVQRAHNAY
jgi:hypothetical protein